MCITAGGAQRNLQMVLLKSYKKAYFVRERSCFQNIPYVSLTSSFDQSTAR